MAAIAFGLVGSGCRQLSSRPVVTSEAPGAIGVGNLTRSWDVFGTDDGHVACLTYQETTPSHSGFNIKSGGESDYRIEINGSRQDLKKGQCLLITNGPRGELIRATVPWMKVSDVLPVSGSAGAEKNLARIQKLFEPLIPNPEKVPETPTSSESSKNSDKE